MAAPKPTRRVFSSIVAALTLNCGAAAFAAPIDDGLSAYSRGDYRRAFDLLEPLADRGDVRAQATIGRMYAKGQGVGVSPGLAKSWLGRAADQGDVGAQVALGDLYAHGEGGARDRPLAESWYAKAAGRGDPAAEAGLARAVPPRNQRADPTMRGRCCGLAWRRTRAPPLGDGVLGSLYHAGKGRSARRQAGPALA